MPEISKVKLTSGDEYSIKDTTAREMILSHTHTNESMGYGYGTCSTAASTKAKTVSISNYKLTRGGIVSILFYYGVPTDATLNINSTGAKPIFYNRAAITSGIINSGDIATFIYDGTRYNLIATDNINNESMGFGYGICGTAASTTAKTVSIYNYKLSTGGMVSIEFDYDVPANATLNINSTGARGICYNGNPITNGIIRAGDTATFIYDGTNYNLIATNNIINESMGFGYGTCSTAASTTAKTVSMSGYKLTKGGIVSIRFDNNVPANATLNINSKGAKSIYHNGAAITANIIKAGDIATFIYDGTNYNLIATNNISNGNESMGFGYGICSTAAATTAKTVSISNYTLSASGMVSIEFNYDVPANATLNINSTGDKPIYYNGYVITSGIIKAGDIATFIYDGTRYNLLSTNKIINDYDTDCYNYASNYNNYYNYKIYVPYNIDLESGFKVKFMCDVYANSSLTVNDDDTKPIYYNDDSAITDGVIKAGDTVTFRSFSRCFKIERIKPLYSIVDTALSTTSTNPVENNIITNALNNKADSTHTHTNESMGFGYGTCDTAAATTAKTVSMSGYKLTKNGMVSIEFDYDVPADSTLNINDTGAKSIYHNGAAITANIIKAGDIATFIYDGTNYNLISLDRDFNPITVDTALSTTSTNPVENNVITNALNNKANSTHTHDPVNMGFGYGTCDTSAGSSAPRIVSIPGYKLTAGGIVSIKFDNDVLLSNPTLNINNTGAKAIYYNGAAMTSGIIRAGDTATFIYDGTRYNLIAINNVINESMGFGFGVCRTAASTTAKTVSISNYKLTRGGIVSILFNYNVLADATLNINNTVAKPIYRNGYAIRNNIINAGDMATFIFDGTNYNLIATDNISNEGKGFGYGECTTAEATTAKTASITSGNYTLSTGGIVSIKFTNKVPANATLNINSRGAKPIYYNGSAITNGIINSGDIATFIYDGTNYNLISLDRDFNPITIDSSLSTASNNPVQNNVIANALNNKADSTHTHTNESMGFGYGTCATEEPETNKTVSISGYILSAGGIVSIKFNYNVLADATLNINSRGAKPIYYNGSAITNGIINSGDIATFIYDGTNYNLISLDRDFNPITIDSSLSTASNNPVQNNVIANALNNKANSAHTHTNESMGYGYGICDTSAGSSAPRIVSMADYKLTKGGIVSIKFDNAIALANATLNINSTGPKAIYYNGAAIATNIIKAGDTATFIYDGTRYNLIAINNVTNESMGFGYGTCSTAAVSISGYKLTRGGIVSINFNHDVPADATLNINSTGAKPIFYNRAAIRADIIKAGDTATFIYDGTRYNLISLDRDFNPITIDSSLSTASNNPVQNNVIANALNNKADSTHTHTNESMGFGYGTCSTAASTTAKTVSISNYKLSTGGMVSIEFDYDVLADSTLNINSTGAKDIYYNGVEITYGIIKAADTATFIYDGTRYHLIAINNIISNERMGFGYGEDITPINTPDRMVVISDYKLTKGGIVSIKFSNKVPANATLSINGTGGIPIYYNGSAITDGIIKAGDIATFIYDGTNYNLIATDNITNESMGQGYGECSTAASTTAKTVSISNYKLTKDGMVSIEFDYDVPANATLNINSKGAKPIYYKKAAITADIIKAGDTATFIYDGTNYRLISIL